MPSDSALQKSKQGSRHPAEVPHLAILMALVLRYRVREYVIDAHLCNSETGVLDKLFCRSMRIRPRDRAPCLRLGAIEAQSDPHSLPRPAMVDHHLENCPRSCELSHLLQCFRRIGSVV